MQTVATGIGVTRLFIRFLPRDNILKGKRDPVLRMTDREVNAMPKDEREELLGMIISILPSISWRMDLSINGKNLSIGGVNRLTLKQEEEWRKQLKYGTYTLIGEQGLQYNTFWEDKCKQ